MIGTLRLASSPKGFAALTGWRGAIELNGSPGRPFQVLGWDVDQLQPDTDVRDGRAYIRAMGGELVVRYVGATHLGFWSGRTGGVAWTGSKGEPSTGGSAGSRFSRNTYGAYVSGTDGVQIVGVRLEGNDRTGLAVHRDAVGTLVSGSTATGNKGDGFAVDRAAQTRIMRSRAVDNGGDGFVLDGRGIGIVATPGGVQVNQARGTVIEGNVASGNRRFGISLLGGQDTVVRGNRVSAGQIGIVVKSGATGTQLVGNTVSGATDAAVQLGPDTRTTTVSRNVLRGARIGVVGQDAGETTIIGNTVEGASQFAITLRGEAARSVIHDNVLHGVGPRAVDVRKAVGVAASDVGGNDDSGWQTRKSQSWFDVFEKHPALLVWLLILLLPLLGWWAGRRLKRKAASHPYPESIRLARLSEEKERVPERLTDPTELLILPKLAFDDPEPGWQLGSAGPSRPAPAYGNGNGRHRHRP